MSKKGKTIFLVLALLLVFTIGVSFAYWAGTIKAPTEKTQDLTVQIGSGHDVETTLAEALTLDESCEGKKLVPAGRATDSASEVESYVYNFTATWTETAGEAAAPGHTGTLTVSIENLLLNDGTANVDLAVQSINVGGTNTASAPIELGGAAVAGTITFTLNEPANVDVYNAVILKNITGTVRFVVAP